EGAIEPLEQVRSKRKATARMLALVEEHVGNNGSTSKVAVTNALVPAEAEAIGRELIGRLGCDMPLMGDLGPVIGTHTGPGCVGIATYI
nr:fatty acid-binding protein DegV [Anaerolineae bacterium]